MLDLIKTALSNPVNVFLAFVLLYIVFKGFASQNPDEDLKHIPSEPTAYNWRPPPKTDVLLYRRWTPMQLRVYDGNNKDIENGRILFAIRRKVYDVTAGRNFYGPGGAYESFAGRDATRGLAKQTFDSDVLTPVDQPIDTLKDLTKSEWINLKEWESHFKQKYFICGDLIENDEAL